MIVKSDVKFSSECPFGGTLSPSKPRLSSVCMLMCGPKANTKTTEKINVVQMCTKSVLRAGLMMESF